MRSRCSHAVRAGVAVAIAALGLAACGSGGGSRTTASAHTTKAAATSNAHSSGPALSAGASTLISAAAKSSEAPGEKIGLIVSINTAQLGVVSLAGAGSYDNSAKSGQLDLALNLEDSSSLGLIGSFLSGLALKVITHDTTVWIALPSTLADLLSTYTGGKPWLEANLEQLATNQSYGGLASLLASSGALTNPIGVLQSLSADGVQNFTTVGTTTIDGAKATHYRADVNVAALERSLPAADRQQLAKVTGISEIPYNVYVDASGRIRRISFSVRPTVAGATASVTVITNVLSYGAQAEPAAPTASESANIATLLSSL